MKNRWMGMTWKLAGQWVCGAAGVVAAASLAGPVASRPAKPPPVSAKWNGVWVTRGGGQDEEHRNAKNATPPGGNAGRALIDLPPMRPEYRARYMANLKAQEMGDPGADRTTACFPPGMPRVMNMPYPMDVAVTPTEVLIIGEWMSTVRHIYTDGRKHPADYDPTYNGHSIGHWEGGTLYVDTVGLRGDTDADRPGLPHSDQMHLKEKIRLIGPDELQDIITVDDPVAFTAPWTITKTFTQKPGLELLDYVCAENNRPFFEPNKDAAPTKPTP